MSTFQNSSRNESNFNPGRWEDFCRKHGETAAKQFAREVKYFVDNNPVYDGISSANVFARKFIEYFNQTFSAELLNVTLADFSEPELPVNAFAPDTNWNTGVASHSQPNSRDHNSNHSPKPRSKFNLRQFFKRSSNVEVSEHHHNGSHDIGKLSSLTQAVDQERIRNKIKKDGILDYLVNLDSGADLEEFFWQKCRVLLYKAPGGYMLEFYAPPKVGCMSHIRYSSVTKFS